MSAVTQVQFDSDEKKILVFASAAHFFTHFFMLVFPALVVPIGTELGVPAAQVLVISFWMYLLYGVLAIGWGFISDHWGHRWSMASGMVLAGVGLTLAGLAQTRALLAVAFAVVGIGCSSYHPSGTALVSQGVRQRGRALGINGIWGNAGIAAAPFVVGVLGFGMGWRAALIVLGAVGTALGVLSFVVPFSVERGTDKARKPTTLSSNSAGVLFAILCIGLVFGGFMYRGFTLVLPTFLETRLTSLASALQHFVTTSFPSAGTERGAIPVGTLAADVIAGIVYVVGMLGQVVGGRMADRHSLKWAYFLYFVAALPFIILTSLVKTPLLVVGAGLYVFFALGMQPIENSLIAALTPAKWRSVSYGVKFTLNFGAGSFAVWLMSAVGSHYGINNSMWVVAGFLLLVIANTSVFLLLSRGKDISQ